MDLDGYTELRSDLTRTEDGDDSCVMGVLKHVTFADSEAEVDLLKRFFRSPDTLEDRRFLWSLEPPLKQTFPDFPQYWAPTNELDYEGRLSNDLIDRLLAPPSPQFRRAVLRPRDRRWSRADGDVPVPQPNRRRRSRTGERLTVMERAKLAAPNGDQSDMILLHRSQRGSGRGSWCNCSSVAYVDMSPDTDDRSHSS